MLRVGLSGGIGSGKSTVAERFRELGAVVIDADLLAREVVAPGSEGLAAIVERFGDEVLEEDGSLNRAALGAVVFADERARRHLEQLTHPRIAARTAALVEAAPADAVVVHDVPLLVEKHLGPGYHLVVVVGADERTRLRRLMEARGMTEEDVRSRMAVQASDEQRRAAADVWLDNGGTKEALEAAVDALWHERLVPFEQNVRHGIRPHRQGQPSLSRHDPTWAAQAQRLLERLRLAFGDLAVTADHIGSTAIDGLPAEDVIDLQVGVPSLEAVDDAAVVDRLRASGFPRAAGTHADNDRGSDATRPERMHGNADPARATHVHVREAGSPGWRWALLLRDWLRADDVACREYAAEKARLAATRTEASDCADGKEPWLDSVHERAEEWARETGWEPTRG